MGTLAAGLAVACGLSANLPSQHPDLPTREPVQRDIGVTIPIADWPATEKVEIQWRVLDATTNAQMPAETAAAARPMGSGAVTVKWEPPSKERPDGKLTLILECFVSGYYKYLPTTFSSDDLGAFQVGRGAVGLGTDELGGRVEGGISRAEQLFIGVRGVYVLKSDEITVQNTPRCAAVTHVISAVSVGAYRKVSTKRHLAELKGKAPFFVDIEAKGTSGASVDGEAGELEACKNASDISGARLECSSPLQLTLREVLRDACTARPSYLPLWVGSGGDAIELEVGLCRDLKAGRAKITVSGGVEGSRLSTGPIKSPVSIPARVQISRGKQQEPIPTGRLVYLPFLTHETVQAAGEPVNSVQVVRADVGTIDTSDYVKIFITFNCPDGWSCAINEEFAVRLDLVE